MTYDEFPVRYCSLCRYEVVVCPACGNNTCNGGYGTVDGKECTVCPDAYRAADAQDRGLPDGYFITDTPDHEGGRFGLFFDPPRERWLEEEFKPVEVARHSDREVLSALAAITAASAIDTSVAD